MIKKINPYTFAIPLIILICLWITSNFNWEENRSGRIIQTDGTGYYAYLPAIFIYQDLNFGFFDEVVQKGYHQNNKYDYRSHHESFIINKYYVGTSIALLPFFLLAHIITLISGYPADGYSYFYMVMISIAAIFYLAVGLIFIRKILLSLNGATEKMVSLILLVIVFGTNMFYYVVEEPSMSHIYSFFFITLFIWQGKLYFDQPTWKNIILISFIYALIILIRPVNGLIIILLPFIAGDLNKLVNGVKAFFRNYLWLITALVVFSIIILIQPVIYKIQTGDFLVYSYGEEGFNFLSPNFTDFLFSYRKGLFVYTPVIFVSLAGGFYVFRQNTQRFYFLGGFLIILIYVLSSWWQWYYGGSYSQRVMIEYYALPSILLGYFLFNVKSSNLKRIYIAILTLLLLINIIQSEQYRIAHIHWSEMNKEKYWKVFLRLDKLIERENPLNGEDL